MADYHKYGTRSVGKLDTCHPSLRNVALLGLQRCPYDITIIHGWRNRALQNALVESGASRTRYPNSKHNFIGPKGEPLSLAFDFGPWVRSGVPWKETHIFAAVTGCFMAAANEVGIRLRWGGDWDGDGLSSDQTLLDWGHVELLPTN